MIRAASAVVLAVTIALPSAAPAQPAPSTAVPMRQAFLSLEVGMTREQVSKVVGSSGPMDLKQETWGRWLPGARPREMEVLRVHFFENRAYWIEYDAFAESWLREEKGGCGWWLQIPFKRLKDALQPK